MNTRIRHWQISKIQMTCPQSEARHQTSRLQEVVFLKGRPDTTVVDNAALGLEDGHSDVNPRTHIWMALRFSTLKDHRSKIDAGVQDAMLDYSAYTLLLQNHPPRKNGNDRPQSHCVLHVETGVEFLQQDAETIFLPTHAKLTCALQKRNNEIKSQISQHAFQKKRTHFAPTTATGEPPKDGCRVCVCECTDGTRGD